MTDRPDRAIDDPPRRSPDRAAAAQPGDGLVDRGPHHASPATAEDGLRATLLDAIDTAMATQPVAVLLVEVEVEVEVEAAAGQQADRLLAERAGQDRLPGGLGPNDAVIGIAAGRVAVVRAGLSAPAEAEGLAYRLKTDLADRPPTEAGPAIRLVAIGTATSRAGDTGHDLLRYAEHAIADALLLGDGRVVSFDDADRDLLL